MDKLTLQMRKDGVSEHCRHLCGIICECIFQEKLIKHAVQFYQCPAEPHVGEVLCSAQLSATELLGVQSLFYSCALTHTVSLSLFLSFLPPSLTFSVPLTFNAPVLQVITTFPL